VERATQTLHGLEVTEEKRLVQRLLAEIRKAETGLAAYGERDVAHALELGAVETLLVSDGLRRQLVELRCGSCGHRFSTSFSDDELEDAQARPCPNCGAPALAEVSREDYVESLFRRAVDSGAQPRLVSTESEEGEMLARAFGGVAAILRYPVATVPAPRARPQG